MIKRRSGKTLLFPSTALFTHERKREVEARKREKEGGKAKRNLMITPVIQTKYNES